MTTSATTEELEAQLGQQIRGLRLRRNVDQQTLAAQAGVALSALKNVESGKGATLKTLLKVLRALDRLDWLQSLSPAVSVSPMQLLQTQSPPPTRILASQPIDGLRLTAFRPMYRTVAVVEVRIWGRLVGAVTRDPRLDYYAFEYAPEFIASRIELAPLTMPLSAAAKPLRLHRPADRHVPAPAGPAGRRAAR